MGKTVVTFGLISGAILSGMMVVTMVLMDHTDFDKGEIIGYTTMVVAFLMVYFGVRQYRDTVAGGTITFGRALKVGALIALVASACYVATWEVIYYKVTPDFADKYAAAMIDKAKKGGASETELKQTQASMEKFKAMYANPVFNVLMTFVEPLPVGLLFALIAAGTLRRKAALA